jgi:hypothetical protein
MIATIKEECACAWCNSPLYVGDRAIFDDGKDGLYRWCCNPRCRDRARRKAGLPTPMPAPAPVVWDD